MTSSPPDKPFLTKRYLDSDVLIVQVSGTQERILGQFPEEPLADLFHWALIACSDAKNRSSVSKTWTPCYDQFDPRRAGT